MERTPFKRARVQRPGVTLGGRWAQELLEGLDVAAAKEHRPKAGMLRIIVEDWLAAWEASGGKMRPDPGSVKYVRQNPLAGMRVPLAGSPGGGVIIPFRPRLVPDSPAGGGR